MTKLKVDILEVEKVEHRGAVNKKVKKGGSKVDGWLITIILHPDGQAYGYVADKQDGEIKPYPLSQLRVV